MLCATVGPRSAPASRSGLPYSWRWTSQPVCCWFVGEGCWKCGGF